MAQQPVIDFRPPDIEAAKVCADRKSNDALELQWSNWDGRQLPSGVEYRDLDRELITGLKTLFDPDDLMAAGRILPRRA